MRNPSVKTQTIHESPSAIIELMEALNKSGFDSAFSFNGGLLEILIRKKTHFDVLS
jgi:hypothetical protein